MAVPTLRGVIERRVITERIATRVLLTGPEGATPVLFLHGNVTSATWWEETMLSLPGAYRGIASDQRGFGAADPSKKIDATGGMGDLADDALALLDHLGIYRIHLVGSSMGGSVAWRLLMAAPERLLTVTLINPGSPYGFGGTKDVNGTPCFEDFAGSGGGFINSELVRRIEAGDSGMDHPFSPRAALRALVYKPPFVPAREDDLVAAMLQTHVGPRDLPGDGVDSKNWPFLAPGRWGMLNAASPKHAGDVESLYAIDPKPPVLWVRGSDDVAISDAAASCPGVLGAAGQIPGWPGAEVYPPQPMLGQTRAVLNRYRAAGGAYREVVIQDTGHVPFIENLPEVNRVFHPHLERGHFGRRSGMAER
jgi:pimeloyl-ACP methyl ester carboxylesterase